MKSSYLLPKDSIYLVNITHHFQHMLTVYSKLSLKMDAFKGKFQRTSAENFEEFLKVILNTKKTCLIC